MAIVLKSDVLIDNPDAPFITHIDPIESKHGSLYLWDAKLNPTSAWSTQSSDLANALSSYADTIVEAPVAFTKIAATDTTKVKTEITEKGGIHFISSKAEAHLGRIILQTNLALRNYLDAQLRSANPNIYFSIWRKTTREAGGVLGSTVTQMLNTGDYVFLDRVSDTFRVKSPGSGLITPDLKLNQSSIIGVPQTLQANLKAAGTTNRHINIGGGTLEPYFATNGNPSWILYRIYIEDLSLSGRTYEQVKAIDDAEFAKAFGVGGKFHGDTWNDPSTILP